MYSTYCPYKARLLLTCTHIHRQYILKRSHNVYHYMCCVPQSHALAGYAPLITAYIRVLMTRISFVIKVTILLSASCISSLTAPCVNHFRIQRCLLTSTLMTSLFRSLVTLTTPSRLLWKYLTCSLPFFISMRLSSRTLTPLKACLHSRFSASLRHSFQLFKIPQRSMMSSSNL